MPFAFSGDVLKALSSAGWSPSRTVDVAPLLALAPGFTPTVRVVEVLTSLGGLRVLPIDDGTQVVTWPQITFVPYTLDGALWIAEVKRFISADFFPIADLELCSVILDEHDRLFLSADHYLAQIGDSFEHGIETVICGRTMPVVIWE